MIIQRNADFGPYTRVGDDGSKIESMTVKRKITSRHGVDSRPLSEWLRDAWRAAANIHPSCAQRLGFPRSSIQVLLPIRSSRCPTALRKGGRSPGGRDRPRANYGEGGDRRAPSTWEAVRLREANWYPTRNVGASEAIQISANRAECVCQCATSLMPIEASSLSAAARQLVAGHGLSA